jgi:hypothetical protein
MKKWLLALCLVSFAAFGQAPPIPLRNGGSAADLSATGGAHQVVKQSSSGAPFTVGQPAFSDLSGSATAAQLPTGILKAGVEWDSNTAVTNGTYPVYSPIVSGTIDSVTYYTGGSGSPTFGVVININGSPATCGTITVTSVTPTTTNCTAANTFTSGQKVEAVVASTGGTTVNTALVQVNYH